jgi:peroxiredoxin
LPTTLVLGPDGTIRFAYVGANTADRPDAARLVEQVKKLR